MNSVIGNLIAVIMLGLIQKSFLATWPQPIGSINLIVVLIVFLIVLGSYRQALWWAFGGGLLLELFSFDLFGAQVISLLLMAWLVKTLFNNFFTNYSFYSLTVLGIIGTAVSHGLLFAARLLGTVLDGGSQQGSVGAFLLALGWQIFIHLVVLYILFFIFHFLIGRLRLNLPGTDALSIDRRAGF